jgi:type I restriction enzyme S subunit
MGTTVHTLTIVRANLAPVPLPPLDEQYRIVQKVDELMTLCNRLEQQTSDQLEAHETLVDTLLGTLTQSKNATELADNWARLAAHFDTLFTTEQSIDKLKQTILQLAVMGRLVEQDAGDESAISYLTGWGIKASEHEMPGWATVELGSLGEILGGATPSKRNPEFWSGSIPWVSPKDMKTSQIFDSQDHVSESAIDNSPLRTIPPQSILMVVRGMILAHSFPVAMTTTPVTINQDMKALVPPRDLAPYLLLTLTAIKATVTNLVERSSHGTCKLKSETLWALPIDLPPLKEQMRILQKVDELMALCDQLKERLNQASGTRCQLAEAAADKALN